MQKVYALVGYVLLPAALAHLALKSARSPVYTRHWRERLGWYRGPACAKKIWVHACSVGEVESCIPLIHALQQRYPDFSCLMTTTTPTGRERVNNAFADTVECVYLPFDATFAVKSFLSRYQPVIAVIVEKEIWPNLFLQCKQNGIPLVLVSAFFSARSFRRYHCWHVIVKPVFQAIDRVGSQTALAARQFRQLGVNPASISVTGNLKFQRAVSERQRRQASQLRQRLFASRPVWIAGSTHEHEESWLLERLPDLLSAIPDVLLVLAPRHPQRVSVIEDVCEQKAIACVTRSSGLPCTDNTHVFMLDTLGELMDFYGAADVAFVGGSLIDHGCHNLLEPAAWGIPIVFGASIYNCEDIATGLVAAGGAVSVDNADQCALIIRELLLDADKSEKMGNNARQYLLTQQGQLENTLKMIDGVLDTSSLLT